jgi:hypothetical protein
MMMIEVIALKNQESATSTEEKSKHTLLANMYSSRLYAATAHAVLVTAPVALIISELNGHMM